MTSVGSPKTGASSASSAVGGASTSTTSSSATTEGVPDEPLQRHIDRLRAEKRRLKEERRVLQKTLKNAEKRKARLKKKARQLSTKDLFDVLALREDVQAQKAAADAAQVPEGGSGKKQA